MKYCPICDERYDEEIIRFCTKDGTPLIDEAEPTFTALPSENLDAGDDFGEETIIRRKPVNAADDPIIFDAQGQSERIVIPTTPAPEQVRPRTAQAYYPPPTQPNTGKTVALTILGTLVVLGFGAGLFWFLQKDTPANINTNLNANLVNQNTNLNTNLGFDSNFNFNTSGNFNSNYNINANFNSNLRTPTPTPKPSPSVSPSPTPTPSSSPTPRPTPTVRSNANIGTTPAGTPRTGPRPPPLNSNRPPGNGN